jgi:hypothetical protein
LARAALAAALGVGLAGCATSTPAPTPASAPTPTPAPDAASSQPDSAREWARLEQVMQARGLMRADYDPPDAPFGPEDLIRDFEKIALHTEFAPGGGAQPRETPVPLSRLAGPVDWAIGGRTRDAADEAVLHRLGARIAALSGLEIARRAPDAPDAPTGLRVLILDREERAFMALLQTRMAPQTRSAFLESWLMQEGWPCMGMMFAAGEGGARRSALILLRAELPRMMRRSCLEEEFVQAFGLLNDGDAVRPSMFNDDEEFAFLTRHDEFLLRILYDPRLAPGMTARQAMPVVREIVAGLDLGADPAAGRVAR